MTVISMGFRSCCIAAVLMGSTMAPSLVLAKPAAVATPADAKAFSAAIEKIQFFEMIALGTKAAAPYNDAAKGLTPGQQEILATALEREIRARRTQMVDTITRGAITAFSHDDIVRISALSAKPSAARLRIAMTQMAQGHPDALSALEKNPSQLGLSDAEQALFGRFFEALMGASNGVVKDMNAALAVAMTEATAPAARTAQPTIAPDYAAFRATAEPLGIFDMTSIIVMRGLRQSDSAANIPADKREAFYALVEKGLNARRDVITDKIMRQAFTTINHTDVEGLTRISQSPVAPHLAASLVRIARDEKDPDVEDELKKDPALTDLAGLDIYLVLRYLKIVGDALITPADDYNAAAQSAADSVLGH